MRIFRSKPDENFTILPNTTLRDERLSYIARGILAELMTHSDGWETTAEALWELARKHRPGRSEGRRAIVGAFAELEEYGYLVRHRIRRERGRFTTTLNVFDTPGHRPTDSGMSDSEQLAFDYSDRHTVDGQSVSGRSLRSTNKEDSATFVDTQVGDARASQPESKTRLERLYAKVDRLPSVVCRNALLDLERRKPRIYRDCRRDAIAQIEERSPRDLKGDEAAQTIDRLSYKYALQHYDEKWPIWLLRPLEQT